MIYFAQDDATLHIKIGLTNGSPEDRISSLQTGNPSKITLLGTMPGDRDVESSLHAQFSTSRVAGEWFRPIPQLLLLIMGTAKQLAQQAFRQPYRGGSLNIYFAGKMDRNTSHKEGRRDWRESMVDDILLYQEVTKIVSLPIHYGTLLEGHNYCGPYYFDNTGGHTSFTEDDHGTDGMYDEQIDEEDPHGCRHSEARRHAIFSLCLDAVKRCDVVFAWIDSLDCYGSLTEVSWATGLGKKVWIAGPRRFRDMWFFYLQGDCCFGLNDPEKAFEHLLKYGKRP